MLYILTYLAVVLVVFVVAVGREYWDYKRHGRLDNKFPITHIGTVQIIAGISLLWIFFLALLIYSGLALAWTKIRGWL